MRLAARARLARCVAALAFAIAGDAESDVTLDGSFGSTGRVPSGSFDGQFADYLISEDLGLRVGRNLFHSFDRFDLLRGEVASFVDTTRSGTIRNVVSRVTGGFPSKIDGVVHSQIPGADLFLLNPGGIFFGPNASIEVPGAFHASTADLLRFDSGEEFAAVALGEVPTVDAEPTAFGFLEPPPLELAFKSASAIAPISVDGSVLQTQFGSNLSLVGGPILIGGRLRSVIRADGGNLHIVAVDSAGSVVFEPGIEGPPRLVGFDRLGRVDVENADLGVFSGGAAPGETGRIGIRGAVIEIADSRVVVERARSDTGPDPDLGLEIVADERFTARSGSLLGVDAGCAATGGGACAPADVEIRAPVVEVLDSGVQSFAGPGGNIGGILRIEASDRFLASGSGARAGGTLEVGPSTDLTGAAGPIVEIFAPEVRLENGASLFLGSEGGPAGVLFVRGGGGDETSLAVTGGSSIGADAAGAGRAGSIRVQGFGSVRFDGNSSLRVFANQGNIEPGSIVVEQVGAMTLAENSTISAEIFLGTGQTSAGDITLDVDSLRLESGGRIGTNAIAAGSEAVSAGNIEINATQDVEISGSGILDGLDSPSRIESGALSVSRLGPGRAGSIRIRAANIRLDDGGLIATNTFGAGSAGTIDLTATGQVSLEDAEVASVVRSSIDPAGQPTADIRVETPSLTLQRAAIRADASPLVVAPFAVDGTIGAGEITVHADTIRLDDLSSIRTVTGVSADAGTVTIRGLSAERAQSLVLTEGSTIDSSVRVPISAAGNRPSGNAGTIDIKANRIELIGLGEDTFSFVDPDTFEFVVVQTSISSESSPLGTGAPGDVTIEARTLALTEGAEISTDAFAAGGGGEITVLADESIRISGSGFDQDGLPFVSEISSGAADAGDAGDVTVVTKSLSIDDGAITSSSINESGDLGPGRSPGAAGNVTVRADAIRMGGEAEISADTFDGKGGTVTIRPREAELSLRMREESQISTDTNGAGSGGRVEIVATSIELRDDAEIGSDTEGPGRGGDVEIEAGTVAIRDGAEVSSDTEGPGDAGNVRIAADLLKIRSSAVDPGERAGVFTNSKEDAAGDAGDIELDVGSLDMEGGVIAATASGASRGGNIRIGARDRVLLDQGAEITATVEAPVEVPGQPVDVANIDIGRAPQARPRAVVLNRGSRIAADATGIGGRAGDIFIGSETYFQSPDSEVSATSASGGELDGDIVIQSPVVDLDRSVAALETAFVDSAALIRASCAARGATDAGSFTVAARRGLPASPEGLLLAFDALDGVGPGAVAGTPATPPVSAAPDEPREIARVAWHRGNEAFRGGNFGEAERQLSAASQHFAEIGDPAQRLDALRGLAQAQQAQGDYAESLVTLRQALALAEESGNPEAIASVLGGLGNAQLALGDAAAARELITRGIGLVEQAGKPQLASGLWNNLGNQQAATGDYEEALRSYEAAARLAVEAGDGFVEAKALSNAARAALDGGLASRSAALLARAVGVARRLPSGHEKAYVLIHLARSQQRLAREDASRQQQALLSAHALLQEGARIGKQVGDARVLSYAYGNLGALYESRDRDHEALYFTHQALRWAEQADAPEALYRWHWQAGRLYWARGQGNEALRSYRRAVAILEETRQETLARYESSELYFRRAVAPVYHDLVDALLQGAHMMDEPADAQRMLSEAQSTVELFRAAELRDYFRDECVVEFQARAKPLAEVSPRAAVLYPILLEDRLELLVGLPGGLERVSVPVPRSEIEAAARRLRRQLQVRIGDGYRRDAEALYGWLVAPVAARLAASGVDTLVFVPDGALRTVPMAALHDGERFLVERYALAVTPGLSLPDPKPLDPSQTGFLLAGVSESVQDFEALPAVPRELEAIHELYGGEVLLDEEFRLGRFESEIATGRPGVVHLATHAVFRGKASESFLLTHDDRLTMDQLGELIGRTRYREQPLELLALSACETAAGDERAALGLAGVAVRAGARSALGSLWTISDDAARQLVVRFYAGLVDPSRSKAQALREAQQQLMASGTFAHPYYWSPFLLISNWL
ncbi:MAG: CHAT domain-containing protein [Myxococcota bacterium]|nr:CHAT domain-containing protein [Myxococcota bacterium]